MRSSSEKPTPCDETLQRVRPEEQRLAGGESAELPTAARPREVAFGRLWLATQNLEPLLAGDGRERGHGSAIKRPIFLE